MDRVKIEASLRTTGSKGDRNQARKEGNVPAVVYGQGADPVPIILESKEFKRALSTAAGSNVLLDLEIKGDNGSSKETVMVKDIQRDPLHWNFLLHADLIRISLLDKLEVEVPLNFTGEPEGAKEGGVFQISTREIRIRCLPTSIPQSIDVPIDGLNIGDVLTVEDIKLPDGIEMLEDLSVSIASVLAPHEEKLEEETEEEKVETTTEEKEEE
jgi:large subunit ribosomal protein L25